MNYILRFLELEALRFACTPVYWSECDNVIIAQTMDAREMEWAG